MTARYSAIKVEYSYIAILPRLFDTILEHANLLEVSSAFSARQMNLAMYLASQSTHKPVGLKLFWVYVSVQLVRNVIVGKWRD